MKYLHYLAAALFLIFALLQLNDPDPLYWIVVYAGAGGVALGRALGRRHDGLEWLVMGAVLAGMLIALPGFLDYLASGDLGSITGSMANARHVEPAREFLGLGMVLAVLLAYRRR